MDLPVFHYVPRCSVADCGEAAPYKLAASWSDGTSRAVSSRITGWLAHFTATSNASDRSLTIRMREMIPLGIAAKANAGASETAFPRRIVGTRFRRSLARPRSQSWRDLEKDFRSCGIVPKMTIEMVPTSLTKGLVMPRVRRITNLGDRQFSYFGDVITLENRVLMTAAPVHTVYLNHPGSAPRIISSKLVGHDGYLNGVSLTFDQPMNETAAHDISRYVVTQRKSEVNPLGYLSIFAKRTKVVVTHPFLRSADYVASTNTVTLYFAKIVKASGTFQVSSPNLPGSSQGHTDARALIGINGAPLGGSRHGGRFTINVGQLRPSSR